MSAAGLGAGAGLVPAAAIAGGLVVSYTINRGTTSRFDYRCDGCGAVFALSPASAAVAPHRLGGRKWVRCPSCGRRSWVTPVPKAGA